MKSYITLAEALKSGRCEKCWCFGGVRVVNLESDPEKPPLEQSWPICRSTTRQYFNGCSRSDPPKSVKQGEPRKPAPIKTAHKQIELFDQGVG